LTAELRGGLEGEGLRIGIVVARFNESITARLLEGARAGLADHGVLDRDVTVVWVPGAFEIPPVARILAESGRHDAVVCLGAVIRGNTDHYRHIAGEAARGIARAGLDAEVPVIFGVLTTDTVEQAVDRAGGVDGEFLTTALEAGKPGPDSQSGGNNGYNAATTAIEMANLIRALDSA